MSSCFSFEIAGVNIGVSCLHNGLYRGCDPSYESFSRPESNPGEPDIEIDLKVMSMNYPKGIPKIFDSGQSWSMSKQKNDYYITYTIPISDKPVWLAKTDENFTRITVLCNTDIEHDPEDTEKISNPVRYPLDQIILMYYLARHGGILVHASGIEINKKGYIFAGRSGAGKTTIATHFLARHYAELLSDDRVIIRQIDHSFRVFGTPWPGKGGIARNINVPLAGIFFLHHSNNNVIEQIDTRSSLGKILPVASIPWYDPGRMDDILKTCGNLIAGVPAYMLHFRPDTDVVNAFEDFLSGTVRT